MTEQFQLLSQALSLQVPILIAGIFFILAIKKRWMLALDRPIDFGKSIAGRRILGANKNWRAPAFYVVLGTLITALIHFSFGDSPWVSSAYAQDPWAIGLATTTAYSAAELVNSFIKRRFAIEPGRSAKTRAGRLLQAFFDNADGALASGLVLAFGFGVPAAQLALAFAISLLIHASTDVWMRRLGLKAKLKQ